MKDELFDESDQAAMIPTNIFKLFGWDGKDVFDNKNFGILIPSKDEKMITLNYVDKTEDK
jgi:hypothetical protein